LRDERKQPEPQGVSWSINCVSLTGKSDNNGLEQRRQRQNAGFLRLSRVQSFWKSSMQQQQQQQKQAATMTRSLKIVFSNKA